MERDAKCASILQAGTPFLEKEKFLYQKETMCKLNMHLDIFHHRELHHSSESARGGHWPEFSDNATSIAIGNKDLNAITKQVVFVESLCQAALGS